MNNSYTIAAAVLQLPIINQESDLKYNSNESLYVCNYTADADSVYYIGRQEYNITVQVLVV